MRFRRTVGGKRSEDAGRATGGKRVVRARRVAGFGVAVVVGGVAVAAAFGFGGTGQPDRTGAGFPPATAKVTRTTLIETEEVSGTLGYGDPVAVAARQSGGIITWLPPIGSTVGRGKPVYNVNDRAVVLFLGTTPFYRRLSSGATGADVRLLEENLSALGYSGFTVDDQFSGATADVVRAWQHDLALDETGALDPGQVVVAASEPRIAEHRAAVGAVASGEILRYTGTTRVVSVPLDVADQHLVKQGIPATVTLPDGARVTGSVASVGTVATKATTGSGANQSTTTTIEVVVTIADQGALGTLDEAPVDVTLVSSRREGVLTVPVGALVALQEGGYGVLVVDGATTRYVAVTTGMFANGRVEISGNGIAEGLTVGVPK